MNDSTQGNEVTAAEFEILQDRLAQIMGWPMQSGQHPPNDDGAMCAMEMCAYIAGEPWSDHPKCSCPTLTSFMVSWNDGLPSDAERDRLLKPLIPRLINTRSTDAVAERRSYLALDWLIRVHTPKWLELVPALQEHVLALRSLPEIVDMAGATAAGEKVSLAGKASAAARAAARAAAWDAAWAAAVDAAVDAAWAAAWAAAGAAAGDAAVDAAWVAAGAAAWAAAWAAAGAAAVDAAGDALKPTREYLQQSALDLFNRMLEVES